MRVRSLREVQRLAWNVSKLGTLFLAVPKESHCESICTVAQTKDRRGVKLYFHSPTRIDSDILLTSRDPGLGEVPQEVQLVRATTTMFSCLEPALSTRTSAFMTRMLQTCMPEPTHSIVDG